MSILQVLNKKIFNKFGIKVAKIHDMQIFEADCNDINSFAITPKLRDKLENELASITFDFWRQNFQLQIEHSAINKTVKNFLEVYKIRPVKDNRGGSRFHNSFWLYTTCSLLKPDLIVESGVWKGHSSWILRQAKPDANIYCFDPCLNNLIYRDERIKYIENDWENSDFSRIDTRKGLCFFDDHVNQAKRVREAYEKGFRTLIFDDAPPAHKLYSFGFPPVPTIDMLFDESIQPGDLIEWMWKGKKVTYNYRLEDEYNAKELIKQYTFFPDVSVVTQFYPNKFLCLVQLKD